MTPFSGCMRRTFIRLDHGARIHLPRRPTRRSVGVVTLCGRTGGDEIGWGDAKDGNLCGVCGRLSGLSVAA